MPVNPYVHFTGNCREAVGFYAEVFETERQKIMSYGDMPAHPDFQLPEAVQDYVMHTYLMICGSMVMFSDVYPGTPYTVGSNVSLALVSGDADQLRRWFSRLAQDGSVEMELQQTDWSACYGAVVDKFGVCWQFNCEPGA